MTIRTLCLTALLTAWMALATAAEWRVGISRVDVTPSSPVWLGGYAARTRPADGAFHPLWAKALSIEDQLGTRVVIVTMDLLGDNFGRRLADDVRDRVARKLGHPQTNIIFNFSHTHSGPVTRVNDGALVTYGLDAAQQSSVNSYTKSMANKLVKLITQACETMQGAQLSYGEGRATFASNRRVRYDPNGPVDHSVPVLRITDESGRLLAALFGYACHNTTLGGQLYKYNGDYAGFAQIAFEQAHPGTTALFMMGCGGDANPAPRGKVELAQQHGRALAATVDRTLSGELHSLQGTLQVRFGRTELPFTDPPTKADLQSRRGQGNIYDQRLTKVLLDRIDRGDSLPTSYPFPAHVVRFGQDLSLVALSGETVVDYALRLRKEFAGQKLWVAGYCNEVFAYVPSERVLIEGGYEGGGAMKYFGIHGPFRAGLEDRIVELVRSLMAKPKK